MAKYETEVKGDFIDILKRIENGICTGSATATLEDFSNFGSFADGTRCAVRVFERYSYSGKNRVSMTVTLFESDGRIQLSAITSGGSQGAFFKLNTVGEDAFLDKLIDIVVELNFEQQ